MKDLRRSYTPGEELASSLVHGTGALIAITGLVLLTLRSRGFFGGQDVGAMGTTAAVLFAASMVCMFLVSTLYHAIQCEKAKSVLRILDHSAIYILIAGTYTPFCLIALRGGWGWALFGFQWGMALTGILINALGIKKLKKLEIAVYIIMGWSIVAGWFRFVNSVSFWTVFFLIAGGVSYTLGVLWYRRKGIPGTHAVWHFFVLAGAVCHWISVWLMLGGGYT